MRWNAVRFTVAVIFCLFCTSIPNSGLAAEHLSNVLKPQDLLKKMEGPGDLRYFHPSLMVISSRSGVNPSDIYLEIKANAGRIMVRVAQNGTIAIPDSARLRAENPVVEFNQPEGTVKLQLNAIFSAQPQQSFQYGLARAMEANVEEAYSRLPFWARMMTGHPSPQGLDVYFGQGVAGTITASCQQIYPAHSNSAGLAELPWRNDIPSSCVIQASPMPKSIILKLKY